MNRILSFIFRYLYALGACLYLFTFGLLSLKNRIFILNICERFGYSQKSKPVIPRVKISGIAPEDFPIYVLEPLRQAGNMTLLEVISIIKMIASYKPERIFEIGTFDGRTTLNMAANSGENAEVFTLDLPKDRIDSTKLPVESIEKLYINKDSSGSRFIGSQYEEKINQLYGDSADFDFSPYHGTMDFVLVDGSHSYEYVLSDTDNALKLLKDGKGVILWHDYGQWDGVTKALNELYESSEVFGNLKHVDGTSLVCFKNP